MTARDRRIATVEAAHKEYSVAAWWSGKCISECNEQPWCRQCQRAALWSDQASLKFDLANAELHNAWSGPTQKQAGYVYP